MSQPFPDFLPHGMGGEMKDRRGKPADPGRYKMPDRNTKHSDENIVRFDGDHARFGRGRTLIVLFRVVESFGGFDGESALHATTEEIAAVGVDAVDVSRGVPAVGGTAARTVQPCPAVLAFGLGIGIATLELRAYPLALRIHSAEHAVPEPHPEMRLYIHGPCSRSNI